MFVETALSLRCLRIFSITAGFSTQAMILTGPLHFSQILMSISNTLFSLCIQVMATWRSVGALSFHALAVWALWPFPRLAGVTCIRCLLLGANTPWNLVKLTLGLGTNAASLAMKSTGSNMTWVVPLRNAWRQATKRLNQQGLAHANSALN